MQYKVFSVPATGGEALEELNVFLRSHRVLGVEKHVVSTTQEPRWVFCVEYLVSKGGFTKDMGNHTTNGKARIDYKEVLSPSDFAEYSKLRESRKEWAEAEGIPAYAIYTNEQLAKIVTDKASTLVKLSKVEGVGESRLKKYGERTV